MMPTQSFLALDEAPPYYTAITHYVTVPPRSMPLFDYVKCIDLHEPKKMGTVHQHLGKLLRNLRLLASEHKISHPGVHIGTLYFDCDPTNTEKKLTSTNFHTATDLAAKFQGGTQPGSAHITASLKQMQFVHDQKMGLLCTSLVLADARYLFDHRHIPNLGISMLPS